MAEMRPAGLTEDGTALRLSDDSGAEHTLRLTDELRSLLSGASSAAAGTADDDGSPASAGDATSSSPSTGTSEGAAGAQSSAADEGPVPDLTSPYSSGPSAATTAAGRRPQGSTRPGADAADEVPASQVSPREIQTRIRAGATAEEVAEATGASLARVRVFEYPVLAERRWIAEQVQQLEVWVGGPDLYSSTVEDGGPSSLGALVGHRLQELGVDPESVTWDAWREGPGPWTVVADFDASGLRSRPTQEQPPARFAFRQGGRHVDHVNRWAQLLADTESWNIGGGRSGGADETPFDVEAGTARTAAAEEHDPVEPTALHPDAAPDPDEELLDILRARRGQRLGADEESDDALALMLTRDETPTPQPTGKPSLAAADDTGAGSAPSSEQTEYLWEDEDSEDDGPLASVHAFRTAAAAPDDDQDAGARAQDGSDGDASETADDDAAAADAPSAPDGAPADAEDDTAANTADSPADRKDGQDADEAPARPAKAQPTSGRGTSRGRIADVLIKDTSEPKPGAEKKSGRAKSSNRRASVPSWDEIVFGRRGD